MSDTWEKLERAAIAAAERNAEHKAVRAEVAAALDRMARRLENMRPTPYVAERYMPAEKFDEAAAECRAMAARLMRGETMTKPPLDSWPEIAADLEDTIAELRAQRADTAAFLDRLAERADDATNSDDLNKIAAECRAMAARLRGGGEA